MRKKSSILRAALAVFTVFLAFSGAAKAQTGPHSVPGPVVVMELFTALGCPSCPAADAMFGQVARTSPGVVALGCHVTYFNRPGRADPVSAPFCDGRQRGYKNSGVLPRIYTPAVVINGAEGYKGTDRASVLTALNAALPVRTIAVSQAGNYLNITLPRVSIRTPADVWLFAYDRNHAVTYITKLLRWDGMRSSMMFPLQGISGTGYAVIAQYADQTNIIAAGKTY